MDGAPTKDYQHPDKCDSLLNRKQRGLDNFRPQESATCRRQSPMHSRKTVSSVSRKKMKEKQIQTKGSHSLRHELLSGSNKSKIVMKDDIPFTTFSDLMESTHKRTFYPSGCEAIDRVMNNGVSTGRMVMLYGPPNSAKSTTAYAIMLQAVKLGKKCIFIDPERKIDHEQIMFWAYSLGMSADQVSSCIIVKTIGHIELLRTLEKVLKQTKNGVRYELVVVDGIYSDVRLEIGTDRTCARNTIAGKIVDYLKKIIGYSGGYTAVLTTNQIYQAWGRGTGHKNNFGVLGGYLIKHAMDAIYCMDMQTDAIGNVEERTIHCYNSTSHQSGMIGIFGVCRGGLMDIQLENDENKKRIDERTTSVSDTDVMDDDANSNIIPVQENSLNLDL